MSCAMKSQIRLLQVEKEGIESQLQQAQTSVSLLQVENQSMRKQINRSKGIRGLDISDMRLHMYVILMHPYLLL